MMGSENGHWVEHLSVEDDLCLYGDYCGQVDVPWHYWGITVCNAVLQCSVSCCWGVHEHHTGNRGIKKECWLDKIVPSKQLEGKSGWVSEGLLGNKKYEERKNIWEHVGGTPELNQSINTHTMNHFITAFIWRMSLWKKGRGRQRDDCTVFGNEEEDGEKKNDR